MFILLLFTRSPIMADETLDASGLNCPLPILKTKKALSKMDAGKILDVISTDAGSVKDIEAFCNQTGNKLMSTVEDGGNGQFKPDASKVSSAMMGTPCK